MKLENKIKCIILDFETNEITLRDATNQILSLFSVESNKIALVHYKEYIEPPHPMLDSKSITRSKIVEVENFTDLNDMFKHIIKIDVLSN